MRHLNEPPPILEAQRRWEETTLKRTIQNRPERRKEFTNESGMPLKRIYTPCDVEDLDYVSDLGFPGEYPFTRGTYATMYRGRIWSYRQIVGFGLPEEANARIRRFVDEGLTGLIASADINISFGHDPDEPIVKDIIGGVGAIMPSLAEWEIYLDGLDLGKLRVSLSQTPTAVIGLGMFIAVARKRGIAIDQLSGTVQNDPLNMFNAEPFPSLSVEGAMRCCMDIFEFTNKNMPKWHPVLINGYNTKESGATPLQELAFLLANATCYLDEAAKRGLSVDQIAPKFAFYFGVGSSFFEEIAKVRAARCMWARIIRDRYGSANPASMLMRYHVQTCGSTLTRQQPLNNVVRCTLQALSAVLGGVSSLHVDSYDEAFAAPSEKAALLSIRTQQIIAEETGVTDVIDPLAGSYYVESLTQEMMRGAQAYLDRIDALGGVLNCVKNHFFTREIAAAAQKYQKEIDRGERTIVGVNAYRTEEEDPIDVYKPDPEIRRQAIERIQKLRATRDQQRWKEALDNVREAAKSKDNLVPAVVEACEAYATFAEIRNVLKEVYGEYEFPAIY